jgi:hypothetical protein
LAGDFQASAVIALPLECPQQPGRCLAPLSVQNPAIILDPIGEGGILRRQSFDEWATPEREYAFQGQPVVRPTEPMEISKIGLNGSSAARDCAIVCALEDIPRWPKFAA